MEKVQDKDGSTLGLVGGWWRLVEESLINTPDKHCVGTPAGRIKIAQYCGFIFHYKTLPDITSKFRDHLDDHVISGAQLQTIFFLPSKSTSIKPRKGLRD